jgi:transposase
MRSSLRDSKQLPGACLARPQNVCTTTTESWSNGQTEGHINRLKTLKRAMYGRASTELLRARMLPLYLPIDHRV